MQIELPRGVRVGHHTDLDAWTGCTVVLLPEGTVAAAEVRGGGPGTRESELLTPSANAAGVDAVLLTGGSAFGLSAAHGVMEHLAAQGIGYAIPGGPVPLVFAAVVYDLPLGDGAVRPTPADAVAACEAAGTEVRAGQHRRRHRLHGRQAARPCRVDEGRPGRGDAARRRRDDHGARRGERVR